VPPEPLIPQPDGSAGRKTATNPGGRTHAGFNLHDEMGFSHPKDHKTYNEFRVSCKYVSGLYSHQPYRNLFIGSSLETVTPSFRSSGSLSQETYVSRSVPFLYDDVDVGCNSCLKLPFDFSQALRKFPFLLKFKGQWPVKVVLCSYFTNRRNYAKGGKKSRVGNAGQEADFKWMEDRDGDRDEDEDMMGHGGWSDNSDGEMGYGGQDYDQDERRVGGSDNDVSRLGDFERMRCWWFRGSGNWSQVVCFFLCSFISSHRCSLTLSHVR
jgi:hypothetical protein